MTLKYTFEQYAAVHQFQPAVGYSPNGSKIAYVDNASGQMNLSVISSGGGDPIQLTHFTEHAVREFAWSPDSSQILFYADHDSDEMHQLYLIDASGGEPVQLTNAPKAQHTFMGNPWSPDGKTIAYSANDRDAATIELVLRDMETGSVRYPIKPRARYYPVAWSPDGEHLTLWARLVGLDQNLVMLHVASGDSVTVTNHDGNDIRCMPGPWLPDSKGFYFLIDMEQEYLGLGRYSLDTGRWQWTKITDHDIEHVRMSENGRYLFWSENDRGMSKLFGRNLYTETDMKMPELPQGVVQAMAVSPDGSRLALIFERAVEAGTLVEVDIQSGDLNKLTRSMRGDIDPVDMIEPELVSFTTFDGRSIPAWYFRPKGEGKFPALLSLHGGPEFQERPEYLHLGMYQYLAGRGIAVLAPNIRGSSGYGMSYQKLIRRDWGGAELQDIEQAAQYLRALTEIDSSRIAVHGRSFGGFATLSAVSRLPDYWVAGVDVVGPANLVTFLKATPAFWRTFIKQWCGDPEEDYDFLMSRSPITHADKIKVPLLVIQGAKDPRVVKAESDQMVERIRQNGGDVRYYVDEHSGHKPTKHEDHYKWIQMIVEYLEEHLLR